MKTPEDVLAEIGMHEVSPGASAYRGEARVNGASPALPTLPFVSAASLAGRTPPDRLFIVPRLIPNRDVTLLSGNGGDGKSLLAVMLLASVSAGALWLGMQVSHGPVIYFCAEDELDEVHRRLAAVCRAEGIDLADLDNFAIIPMAGQPALLAVEGKGGAAMVPTPLWNAFATKVSSVRPALVVVDNVADVFGGNEISRAHVRSFIGLLRGLAFDADAGILLLSHPSVAGMQTGTGLSGSTGWNNSVRSRLYLTRPTAAREGQFADPDARILQSMKANYGPLAAEIHLRWIEGRFVNESGKPASKLDKATVEATAEAVFLDLLQQFELEGRNVSPNPGRTYAPSVFADHEDSRRIGNKPLESAMNRLLKAKKIRIEMFGSPSRQRSRLSFSTAKATGNELPTPFQRHLPTPALTFQRPSNGVCVPTPHTPRGVGTGPPVGRRASTPEVGSLSLEEQPDRSCGTFVPAVPDVPLAELAAPCRISISQVRQREVARHDVRSRRLDRFRPCALHWPPQPGRGSMSRTAAKVTQADVARILRAVDQVGHGRWRVRVSRPRRNHRRAL